MSPPQATSNSLRKLYDAGEVAREQDSSNAQNDCAPQFNLQQEIQPSPTEAFEEILNIASLTSGEHKIYEYLHAHGWSEKDCSIYFRNSRAMQEVLAQYFLAQGWSEGQLKAFNETCDSELPQQFSTLPATDCEWQVKLLEEANRRKRIGENMNLFASDSTHDP